MIQLMASFFNGKWVWIAVIIAMLGFAGLEYYKKELMQKELEILRLQNKKLEDITMTTIGVNADNAVMFSELKQLMNKSLNEISKLMSRYNKLERELKKLKQEVRDAEDGQIAPALRVAIDGLLGRATAEHNQTSRASENTDTNSTADTTATKFK